MWLEGNFAIFVLFTLAHTLHSQTTEEPCNGSLRIGLLPLLSDENDYIIDLIRSQYSLMTNLSSTQAGINERLANDEIMFRSSFRNPETLELFRNCYVMKIKRLKFPKALNPMKLIYDDDVLKEFSEVDVIIGEYRRSVHAYARNNSVPFIVTAPTDLRTENIIRGPEDMKDEERVVFSAWYSWKDFFQESVDALSRFRKEKRKSNMGAPPLGRVLIVQHLETNYTGAPNELLESLIRSGNTTWVKLVTVTERFSSFWAFKLAKAMLEEKPDILIYMFHKASQLQSLINLKKYVRLHPSAKNSKTATFLWDMTHSFSGNLRSFLTKGGFGLSKYFRLKVVTLIPSKPFGVCEEIKLKYDMTPIVGGAEAMVIVMANIIDFIPSAEFSKAKLLSRLQVTNRNLTLGYPSTRYLYSTGLPYFIDGGFTFYKGFRFNPTLMIGILRPVEVKKLRPGSENEYIHDNYTKCDIEGQQLSKYFENKTIPMDNPEHRYLRQFRTPDEEANVTKANTEKQNKVVVVLEDPFAIKKDHAELRNRDFDGLCPTMIKEIFDRMGRRSNTLIEYEFYVAPNNSYGSLDPSSNKWNGAMGELQNGNAVLAIGMISKTVERARFFAYSPPFEYVGLTWMAQNHYTAPSIFNFMRPFELSIWYGIMLTFFLSGIFIYILEYWNPFMDRIEDDHRFSWSEVMWFSFGTVSGAGGSFAPVIYPTRVFSVFYWFFALIITATYTGNLASFLTESFQIEPRGSLELLGYTDEFNWATLRNSYMDNFIRGGTSYQFRNLALKMKYVKTYTEGVEFVEKDTSNVFIGNHLLLNYHKAKSTTCNLGVSLTTVAFTELAFPMRHEWANRKLFHDTMVQMRDDGKVKDTLENWLQMGPCSGYDDDHTMLHFASFAGLLMILSAFTIASFVVLAVKLVWLKIAEKNKKKCDERKDENPEEAEMVTPDEGGNPKSTEIEERV